MYLLLVKASLFLNLVSYFTLLLTIHINYFDSALLIIEWNIILTSYL